MDESLLVLADFADLKSPWIGGHSRAVAALALNLKAFGPEAEAGALVHDLGRVAIPNTIWDKPGSLTRDERDRAELHTLVTEQLLRRVSHTAGLAASACAAHERVDGSGYHRRVGGAHIDEAQRVIAARGLLGDGYRWCTVIHPNQPELMVNLAVPGPALAPDLIEAMKRAQAAGGMPGLGLKVDDCQKTYEDLSGKDVEFMQPPSQRPYGTEALCRDNSGNWLVLVQPATEAFTADDFK